MLFWTERTENKMENNALLSDLHILLTISGPDQFKFLNIIFRNKYLKITLIQVSAVWKLRKAPSLLLITYIVCSPSIHVEDCNTSSQKNKKFSTKFTNSFGIWKKTKTAHYCFNNSQY